MIKATHLSLLILFIVFFAGCKKSSKKALIAGDYYNATLLAVDKLKKDADNSKALEVLPQAYQMALADFKKDADAVQTLDVPFRYEQALDDYTKLNRMYEEIESCSKCRKLVSPKAYYVEADEVRGRAAAERYAYADKLLQKNTMESGRAAYESFKKLYSYAPDYRDVQQKMDEALYLGSIHVVVEQPRFNPRLYSYNYSYDFFQGEIEGYLRNNQQINPFVQFYSPREADRLNIEPDQIIRLEFIDFVVGQTLVESNEKTVTSKDSVKTGTATIKGEKVDVYGKVSANVKEFRKQVHSHGVLLMQIIDYQTNGFLFSRELPGEYNWYNTWLTYNGDKRALTPEQIQLSKSREEVPPPPPQLFKEFCRPIYNQFTTEIQNFYRKA